MRELVYLIAGILIFLVGYVVGWTSRARRRLKKWKDSRIHRPVDDREGLE